MLEVEFLGTGTSQGIPIIGCECDVCSSENKKDGRLRSSAVIKIDKTTTIVIDCGPDFRYQMLRAGIKAIDAIVFTHYHKDHTAGLDEVRALNYIMQKPIPIYAEQACIDVIKKDYDYAFSKDKYPGVPEITANTITTEPFYVNNIEIIPIRGTHFKMPVLGYRIGNFCYLTDMSAISDEEINKIKGVDTLVINALRHEKHLAHFSLKEALVIIEKIGARNSYITHVSHQLGLYEQVSKTLPKGVFLSYDGLKIEVK